MDKKARIVILFLTLCLVVHVFITAFPVVEIIKYDRYSSITRETYFQRDVTYAEEFYFAVKLYVHASQDNAKIANGITEEEINNLTSQNSEYFKDDSQLSEIAKAESIKNREVAMDVLKQIHKQREEMLEEAAKKLESYNDLKYYFIDNSNIVYSNIFIDKNNVVNSNVNGDIEYYLKNQSLYYYNFDAKKLQENEKNFYSKGDILVRGYIIVPKELPMGSKIYNDLSKIGNNRKAAITTLIIFAIELLCTILLILLIIKKKIYIHFKDDSANLMKHYFKINFEIRVFIILLLTYIMLVVGECYYNTLPSLKIILVACFALFLQFLFYIFLSYFNKNNRINNRDKSIIYNFYRNLKLVRNLNKLYFKIFFSISLNAVIGATTIILILDTYQGILGYYFQNILKLKIVSTLTIFFIIPLVTYTIKNFMKINNVIKSIENISIDNLDDNSNIKENDEFFNAYESIKNIKTSIESAVEERLKSERLKTELITNVSHDLKTPLTSIINYVDLMKKNNLSEEDSKAYLEIIDKKSKRLKVLIEELFEASKLNSGDIELNKEKVDLVSLIKQTLGEFEKQIEHSQLELILKLPNEKVYLELDGKKIWRVFENILNNIFKYSQKNTRVYIDLIGNEKQVMVITKNISAYQLNINHDELFEKFKRGDESRNTEGSGLGLSIARGIMEIHGGEMKIEVDGDLFKNILIFNKE